MKVIMAVHPYPHDRLEETREFLEEEFRAKVKPVFLYFSSYELGGGIVRRELIHPLIKEVPGFKENFIEVTPEGKYHAMFQSYEKSFLKAVGTLMRKIGGAKEVEIISFGGARDTCYENIANEAHLRLSEELKRMGKITVHRTYLPFMWGKPNNLKQARPYSPEPPRTRRKVIPMPRKIH